MSEQQWSPLDGVPPPDYIPATWTPEHAARRLVEAYETLQVSQVAGGPRQFGTAWPRWIYEFDDLRAQCDLTEDEKKERAREQNRTVRRASAQQIAEMERVFGWLSPAFDGNEKFRKALMAWANAKARNADMRKMCHHKGWSYATFQRRRKAALEVLAAYLNRIRAVVF